MFVLLFCMQSQRWFWETAWVLYGGLSPAVEVAMDPIQLVIVLFLLWAHRNFNVNMDCHSNTLSISYPLYWSGRNHIFCSVHAQQPNTNDCGAFAIAFLAELLFDGSPTEVQFDVGDMRWHLNLCLLMQQPYAACTRALTPFMQIFSLCYLHLVAASHSYVLVPKMILTLCNLCQWCFSLHQLAQILHCTDGGHHPLQLALMVFSLGALAYLLCAHQQIYRCILQLALCGGGGIILLYITLAYCNLHCIRFNCMASIVQGNANLQSLLKRVKHCAQNIL